VKVERVTLNDKVQSKAHQMEQVASMENLLDEL